jgi:PIN domain nuclease of toxin-antitoxin system
VRLLLDTHILLWATIWPERLSAAALSLLEDEDNELMFSAASLWEVAIKCSLGRPDFQVDPRLLRRGLLDNGYVHKDPFDRILVAQASVEGITLVTADPAVARYPAPITQV